jgi:CheY-like chemotaxis protein
MTKVFRIAVLGFSDFERTTLASCFRLATNRDPQYALVKMLTDADFVVADADHAPSVQLVVATERMDETVFIGALPPMGATAWMARPIDPLHVMRELDGMAGVTAVHPAPAAMQPSVRTVFEPPAPPLGAMGTAPVASLDDLTWVLDLAPAAANLPPPPAAKAPVPAPVPAPAPTPAPTPAPVAPEDPAPAPTTPNPPAQRRRQAAPAPRPAEPPVAMPPPPPPRALLVDDSEIALRFLESRLQRWGMVMDRAATSSKAIELLARRDYDFVFLDLELGPESEMDGLALCQHIKRNQSANAAIGSSVFIVSAHQTELDRVRASLAGCDAYLGKPLQELDLRRLLLRHGLQSPAEEAPRDDPLPG